MADWFERKPTLFDLVNGATPQPKNSLADIVEALCARPTLPTTSDTLGGLFGYVPPPFGAELDNPFGYPGLFSTSKQALPVAPLPPPIPGGLASLFSYTPPETKSPFGSLSPSPFGTDLDALGYVSPFPPKPSLPVAPKTGPAPQQVKRKVFFSFHFADLLRVNNVRQTGKINDPSMRGFYDRSLWESKKLEGPKSLKKLIRTSMVHASTVCVLVGSDTWSRRWVKYEIAQSIVGKRGLLAVHLNSINHHHRKTPDLLGQNPLSYMGIYQKENGSFYLCEKKYVVVNRLTGESGLQWFPYSDFAAPVPLPRYMNAPGIGIVQPLNEVVDEYDFTASVGHKNIGAWIDRAAARAGRSS